MTLYWNSGFHYSRRVNPRGGAAPSPLVAAAAAAAAPPTSSSVLTAIVAVAGRGAGAEAALAQAVSDVLQFSGLDAAAIDVAFFEAQDEMAARLARVGLRFDLPRLSRPEGHTPPAPGLDPEKPPKLR